MTVGRPHDTASASAPGKVILLGEHAVVYGRSALAAAIDRSVTVRITPAGSAVRTIPADVGDAGGDARVAEALVRAGTLVGLPPDEFAASISTDLPIAKGLGSSAALSVALIRALARFTDRPLDDASVCAHAYELEKIFHGFPSGIDNTVAAHGGLIAFTRGAPIRRVPAPRPLPLVVALGRAPRQTQQTVRALRHRWEAAPHTYDGFFDEIAALVSAAESAILAGDLVALGAAMSANHTILQRLGVSTEELQDMVQLARTRGALGAKLTGGGGGGAVICLCDDDRAALIDAFLRAGWQAFAADVAATQRGVHATDGTRYMDEHTPARA